MDILHKSEFDTVTFGKIKFDELGGISGGGFIFKKVDNGKIIDVN